MALKSRNPSYFAGFDEPEVAASAPDRLSPRASAAVIVGVSVLLWSIIAEVVSRVF